MNRREFSGRLAGAGLAMAASGTALAQGGPVEGQHYVRLQTPAPVTLPEGKKLEVVEFFWYECPHCNAFEPMLEGWVKKLPPDIYFRQVPVGFTARHVLAQKLFYTLEEMGQLPTLHRRIFAAVHVQNKRMSTEGDIQAWVKEQGVDMGKFNDTWKSFQVATKSNKAKQLSDAYKIDGVPALGINGRFFTSGALAGSHDRALAVADFLIQRARQA